MDQLKVSVIVPVYNAQQYLEECLASIFAQTLKDFEVICVDDGSTDSSIEILERLASEDNRLRILHQEHKYAGEARNLGMNNASGKYLIFWDADDYFYPTALEDMYKQCEKDSADVCICSGRQYFEDGNFEAPSMRYIRKKEIPETIPFSFETDPDHVMSITVEAPWNKMFLADFVREKGIRFQNCRNANDVYFVENALCLADRITLVDKQLVCYRKSKKSGLVTTVSKGLMTALQTWLDTADSLRKANRFPERSFSNRALESILYLFNNSTDWEAYKEAYLFLQSGNLERLAILKDRPEDYYYISYHSEAVEHLYSDTPERFLKWINNYLFNREAKVSAKQKRNNEISRQNEDALQKEMKIEKRKRKNIEQSLSYKIGCIITWLPRSIKRFLNKLNPFNKRIKE